MQAVIVDMEGAVYAVGDACGFYADAGVVDGGAAAGKGEAVERARSRDGAAHASGDVAEEAADERFCYHEVDAVEVGSKFHPPGLGMVGAGGAQHFAAVQVVTQHYVELVVGVVPIGARPEHTGIHAAYLQGVAVERSYGLDAVGEGRGEHGPASGAAVDVVIVFEEVVYHGHVHVVQFQPQGVGPGLGDAAVETDALVAVVQTEAFDAGHTAAQRYGRLVQIPLFAVEAYERRKRPGGDLQGVARFARDFTVEVDFAHVVESADAVVREACEEGVVMSVAG